MSKQKRSRRRKSQKSGKSSRRQRRLLWIGGGLLALIVLIAGVGFAIQQANQPLPGESVPIQGNQHIRPGQTHPPYNSDPPTSGWHYDRPLPAGFYEESVPDEQLVHNLEHGHVVIAYDCAKLTDCAVVKSRLSEIVRRFNGWKITVVSRQNADAAIALTAWGRIDKLDQYDERRIIAFIEAWRDRGPERTSQ